MKGLVVGIGHPFRRDDSVGPRIAWAVVKRVPAGIDVIEHHGEGTDLMARWDGYDRVVLVDATCSGVAPGTVRHWDALAGTLPAGLFPKSSHLFGPAEAIEMARRLGRLPPALAVVGIEGADFSAGQGLSGAVEDALPEAVARVRDLLG